MKKSYEERGIKFGTYLAKLFQNCDCYSDFAQVITNYNRCHTRRLNWAHGFTRIAIIRADYVIKFTYREGSPYMNRQKKTAWLTFLQKPLLSENMA